MSRVLSPSISTVRSSSGCTTTHRRRHYSLQLIIRSDLNLFGMIDKVCVACKISKTPLWRSGPAGPKSLCNACGIRFRKKSEKKKVKSPPPPAAASPTSSSSSTNGSRPIGFRNREVVVLRRQRSRKVKRGKFGEEEEAAFVLMALSCGLVFG